MTPNDITPKAGGGEYSHNAHTPGIKRLVFDRTTRNSIE